MKKIGHEVLFLPTGEGNPRNGEGTFTRLSDGRILFAYTHYYGDDWHDHAIARIEGCYSSDEGETWSESVALLEKDDEAQNLMSPSLFLLSDGALGMVYLRKEVVGDQLYCNPWFRRSDDFGATWSEAVLCVDESLYYCAVNDCACISGGRILIPMSRHAPHTTNGAPRKNARPTDLLIVCSDDNGKTWRNLSSYKDPFETTIDMAEPGVYIRENGEMWSWCRTGAGHQYQCFSRDGGKTMSGVAPNFCFTSPDSPMRVKKCGKYLTAVFNPIPFNCLSDKKEQWKSPKRSPLVCAVSTDDGDSFGLNGVTPINGRHDKFVKNCYLLEDDRSNSYCYPAIQPVEDGFLVHYYHSNGTPICLNSAKIVKVRYDELDG